MKKIIKFLVCVMFIALVACGVIVITKKDSVFPRRVSSNPDAIFYVKAKDDEGNTFYINLDCVKESEIYI